MATASVHVPAFAHAVMSSTRRSTASGPILLQRDQVQTLRTSRVPERRALRPLDISQTYRALGRLPYGIASSQNTGMNQAPTGAPTRRLRVRLSEVIAVRRARVVSAMLK